MNNNNLLKEIDSKLNENDFSLKKKIFSLSKMESLVFSDPKLNAVYEEMAENGENRFGYHYNETIMNIIFNDYVLNSPKYLQKYKNAIPQKKKRRDKSGINQLKKDIEDKDTNIDETTTCGSAAGSSSYVGFATPKAWTGSDKPIVKKSIWPGGTILNENYITETNIYEFIFEEVLGDYDNDLKVIDDLSKKFDNIMSGRASEKEKIDFKNEFDGFLKTYVPKNAIKSDKILKEIDVDEETMLEPNQGTMAMKPPINANFSGVETGVNNSQTPISEESKSKSQKRFMNMVKGVQTGKIDKNKVSDEIINTAKNMSKKDVEDFVDTNYEKLPEKITEMDKLFEELNDILDEDRKISALVSIDRIGDMNKNNFKSDLKNSSIVDVTSLEKSLEYKKQQENVEDPQKLGKKLEKDSLKSEVNKNNFNVDDESYKYRFGVGDYTFDNDPGEKFTERMKKDMGEELYKQREEKLKEKKNRKMYNKEAQPVENINEKVFTGKYLNDINMMNKFVDFKLSSVVISESVDESWKPLDLNGLGNFVNDDYTINEEITMPKMDYFYSPNDNLVYSVKCSSVINESVKNEVKNDGNIEKIKKLFNYNPSNKVDTTFTKANRGF